jgi:hypothetical protein
MEIKHFFFSDHFNKKQSEKFFHTRNLLHFSVRYIFITHTSSCGNQTHSEYYIVIPPTDSKALIADKLLRFIPFFLLYLTSFLITSLYYPNFPPIYIYIYINTTIHLRELYCIYNVLLRNDGVLKCI